MVRRARGVAGILVCALAGCAHPVGPARTFDAYEGKAVTTAEGAVSNVATARLAVEARTFGTYAGTVVSDAEESLAGLQGTFGSVQPPDARADRVRDELDRLLADAGDDVTEVRIAVRRGQHPSTSNLRDDARKLEAFVEAHS